MQSFFAFERFLYYDAENSANLKKTYVTYRIIGGQILLLLNHKGYWSGSVSKESIPTSKEVGFLHIYEGRDNPDPVERLIFCTFDKELHIHGSSAEKHPTFFPLHQKMPVEEMEPIQRKIIAYVTEGILFEGALYFVDSRRVKTYQEFINPPISPPGT